jgi:hypothetical protein
VFCCFRWKRSDPPSGSLDSGNRGEVVFWSVSAATILLISFGAFTPFYRLIFALPAGDYIRCPVKFVHLVEWCVAVLAGFGAARLLTMNFVRRMPVVAAVAVGVLLIVNMFNLAAEDAKFCAVDPADAIRVAIAKDTGVPSLAFAMDGNARIDGEEYLLAGGTAFRDSKILKDALAKGEYSPVSFWNFQSGRFVKTSRERAGFALLKSSKRSTEGPVAASIPGGVSFVSVIASCFVCVVGCLKLFFEKKKKVVKV